MLRTRNRTSRRKTYSRRDHEGAERSRRRTPELREEDPMPNDRFVTLLYYLVRDELPLGQVESIVDRMVRDEAFVPDPTLLAWCEIQRDRLPVYVYGGDLGAEALGGVTLGGGVVKG